MDNRPSAISRFLVPLLILSAGIGAGFLCARVLWPPSRYTFGTAQIGTIPLLYRGDSTTGRTSWAVFGGDSMKWEGVYESEAEMAQAILRKIEENKANPRGEK